jgi:hypothetical protein
MMRSRVLIAFQSVLIVLLAWALVYYARDEWKIGGDKEDEAVKSVSRSSVEEGRGIVTLPQKAQAASGIETAPLSAVEVAPSYEGYGLVMNLQPLIELRGRYFAARSEAVSARASLNNTSAEYKRLAALFEDDRNVSERAVQAAEAAWKADQARVGASEQLSAAVLDTMKNQWGNALSELAIAQDPAPFERLVRGAEDIVQVALPSGTPSGPTLLVRVGAPGSGARSRPAQYVSASPQTDPALQGQTFFYRVAGEGLRIGMRLEVAVQTQGNAVSGIEIPKRAVVWYAGKPWVYVKATDERFARFEVQPRQDAGERWITTNGLPVPGEVVVSGAQLLLSEELKYQIKGQD